MSAAQGLLQWTPMYNWHKSYSGIKDQMPVSRLNLNRDNLLRRHR